MIPIRFAVIAAGLVALAGRGTAGDEELIPSSLPAAKRDALKSFLTASAKPKQFLPPTATIKHSPASAHIAIDTGPPADKAEVTQYLAAVIAHRATDAAAGPAKADVYWYRPNLKAKKPGVTIKQTVDLMTGKPDGNPEVLVGYPAPLSREERAQAIELAKKDDAVRAVYATTLAADVEVGVMSQTISATGHPLGAVGDRVATLKFRKKGSRDAVAIDVNVTQETVRKP